MHSTCTADVDRNMRKTSTRKGTTRTTKNTRTDSKCKIGTENTHSSPNTTERQRSPRTQPRRKHRVNGEATQKRNQLCNACPFQIHYRKGDNSDSHSLLSMPCRTNRNLHKHLVDMHWTDNSFEERNGEAEA